MQRPAEAIAEDDQLRIAATHGMRGWFAILCTDIGDPIATGFGSYKTRHEAEEEAIEWAASEGALDRWKFDFNLEPHKTLVNEINKQQQQQNMADLKPKAFKILLDKEETSDGEIVKCIRGTIKSLYPVKKGEGQSGPYEFQNGTMTDEAGTDMKVTFSNNTQPPSAKGKKVTITSQKSDQHGWQGIKVVDSSYTKNNDTVNERVLKITGTGKVEYDGGTPSGGEKPSGGSSGGGEQTRPASNVHPIVILKDIVSLHAKVVDLVNEIYGDKVQPEYYATVFIEACRQGCQHDAVKRLAAPVPVTYPPAPKDPTKWRECVIPKGELAGKTLEEIDNETLMEFFVMCDEHESPKVKNGAFAECVYKAAEDRGLLKPKDTPQDPDNDQPEDDIPF